MTDTPAPPSPASAAGCYLPELCVVDFTGPDAREFLQGYLTCDTDTLADDGLTPWALCNLKGRVVANGWCRSAGSDTVELLLHHSLAPTLAEFFKAYLMFSKTRLNDSRDAALIFGATLPEVSGALAITASLYLVIVKDMAAAGAIYDPSATANAWRAGLIGAGICLVSEPTSGTFLPQMLGMHETGAVSFDKGCYLGQEVVARAQHRGSVKRRLQPLRWQGPQPQPGDDLTTAAGDKAGTLINAATSEGEAGIALAVVANEAAYPLQIGDTVLTQAG